MDIANQKQLVLRHNNIIPVFLAVFNEPLFTQQNYFSPAAIKI